MGPPDTPPIGLLVSQLAKTLSRAFEEVLAEAGGSQPVWLVLLGLTIRPGSTQRQLAADLGIREATMTHHLNGMERDGLITRRRDPDNRRVHQIVVTPDGRALFGRLRAAAIAFDEQLRAGIDADRLEEMTDTLRRLATNAEQAARITEPGQRARQPAEPWPARDPRPRGSNRARPAPG